MSNKTALSRRDVLKLSGLTAVVCCLPLSAQSLAKPSLQASKKRKFSVTFKHKILEKGNTTRLWVPLPLFPIPREDNIHYLWQDIEFEGDYTDVYQYLGSDIEIEGNYTICGGIDTQIPTLYAEFDKIKEPYLDLSFDIITQERSVDLSAKPKKVAIPKDIKEYLKATTHIQTDGIVKKTAQEIINKAKAKSDVAKAKALFDWVAENMQRDESIMGCGIGDAKAILESKKLFGKCTNISSVFVALCRSVGVPAREVFGIRLGQSRFSNAMGSAKDKVANITKAQHCRAEFFANDYGWIPCDPGDVAKVKLAENLSNEDAKIKELKAYLFGNWEMCWCAFNTARYFVLTPQPDKSPLNNFGYPYAEVDGNVLNYYEPNEFSYTYTAVEK